MIIVFLYIQPNDIRITQTGWLCLIFSDGLVSHQLCLQSVSWMAAGLGFSLSLCISNCLGWAQKRGNLILAFLITYLHA